MFDLQWLLIAIPLASGALLLIWGKESDRFGHLIGTAASAASFVIGVVLFVVTRIANVSFEQMSRAILPWLVPLLVVLLAISIWPPLTMWLPNMMHGK